MSSFEDKLKKLEQIVSEMEKGDLPLEKALASFEEGVGLAKLCTKELDEAELKIKVLSSGGSDSENKLSDFQRQDGE